MDAFWKRLKSVSDRRKVADRRSHNQTRPYNRRMRPDRRLNNILVEWIPFGEIALQPAVRESLTRHRSTKRLPAVCKNYPSVVNIFTNTFDRTKDLRKVDDRRVREHKLPYDRRMRPDRRLNNIVVEWNY